MGIFFARNAAVCDGVAGRCIHDCDFLGAGSIQINIIYAYTRAGAHGAAMKAQIDRLAYVHSSFFTTEAAEALADRNHCISSVIEHPATTNQRDGQMSMG